MKLKSLIEIGNPSSTSNLLLRYLPQNQNFPLLDFNAISIMGNVNGKKTKWNSDFSRNTALLNFFTRLLLGFTGFFQLASHSFSILTRKGAFEKGYDSKFPWVTNHDIRIPQNSVKPSNMFTAYGPQRNSKVELGARYFYRVSRIPPMVRIYVQF